VWCSLWGTDWILKYYLDELRFQTVMLNGDAYVKRSVFSTFAFDWGEQSVSRYRRFNLEGRASGCDGRWAVLHTLLESNPQPGPLIPGSQRQVVRAVWKLGQALCYDTVTQKPSVGPASLSSKLERSCGVSGDPLLTPTWTVHLINLEASH